MYVLCLIGNGGAVSLSAYDESPRVRQLSAGRTRYGAISPLASSRNPLGLFTRCLHVIISCHQYCVCGCVFPALWVSWAQSFGEKVIDEPSRPCCFSRYVRIAARTTFVVLNNIYCIPAYVVWMMALRLVRPLYAPLYWKIEGFMYHWLLAMVSMWSWSAGYEIMESGDEPAACSERRTLVLANHQSTADVPMLMAAWNPRPGVLPNLMWIMDRVFKFTNFGIVSVLHEDFFIQAGKANREQSLEQLRRHIYKYYVPLGRQFMVLFPEGGFLHKRREISQRFAEKNNLPKLDYVSLPRAGAMKVIMEEIGPHKNLLGTSSKDGNRNMVEKIIDYKIGDTVEWILDVTIAYPERIPLHLQDIVCAIRPPCTTHLYYRLYPSSEVPPDTEGMTNWLYDRFIEKDKMLEEFYRTGTFPEGSSSNVTRRVRQDNLRYLILHIFFIASTFLQYQMFTSLISYIW